MTNQTKQWLEQLKVASWNQNLTHSAFQVRTLIEIIEDQEREIKELREYCDYRPDS